MGEKRERKSNLLTVRLTDEEKIILDCLSDRTNRSTSDTLLRACKFFLNMENEYKGDDPSIEKKERKRKQVHIRVTDVDMRQLTEGGERHGMSISEIIRSAIKAFDRFTRGSY